MAFSMDMCAARIFAPERIGARSLEFIRLSEMGATR
jgi:hypothetical protein